MTNPEVSVICPGIHSRSVPDTFKVFHELENNQILVVNSLSALSADEVSVDGNER